MKPSSTTIFYLIILSATIIFYSCSSDSSGETSISWDRYGVPHIKAKYTDELFFAQGWALMQNHANKVLELYGKSRGKASEYWGEQYLQNDILIHTLGFEELSQEWDLNQLPELKSMYNNFVKGISANITQDKYMDYFYAQDIGRVIECIIANHDIWEMSPDFNLCYRDKYKLSEYADMIKRLTNNAEDVIIRSNEIAYSYTGDCFLLEDLNLELVGLEKGLKECLKNWSTS